MDQQHISRDRSPSQGHQFPGNINQTHSSPSPTPFQSDSQPSIGLGLGLESSTSPDHHQQQHHHQQQLSFDNSAGFMSNQQLPQVSSDPALAQDPSAPPASSAPFATQPQDFSAYSSGDFPLFQPTTSAPAEQYSAPLFESQPGQQDMSNMASPQTHHNPTPPHLLNPEPHQPPPGHQSPQFGNSPYPPQGASHSRNASLGPENALMQGQMAGGGWEGPAFQGHRRSPSEYSDVSSVAPSPNLPSTDTFDQISQSHSPMQRPQDGSLYDSVGFESFTISDNQPHSSPNPGRSPSHSPAISPRVMPQQMAGAPSQFTLQTSSPYMQPPPAFAVQPAGEAFPSLPSDGMGGDMSQVPMATPSISFTPAPQGIAPGFEGAKPQIDADSLTPPESRGRAQRRRAHTDPYSTGSGVLARPPGSLSPNLGAELRSDARSLSPLDRQPSPSSRRKSIGSVPNNEMALRLADPEYGQEGGPGGAKRQQKHPATFSCHLCPKKFTRAYNLRSHLRTHTDERPFVCSVCGKAFARQHDRKRHEGLHSGEKKFVCKGDLKQGGQWGCGRRFARADALGRHFRSEAGRICIKPLLDEEMVERQRAWHEQRMQQNLAAQQMAQPHMLGDPNAGYPMDPSGGYALPQALLAQYPALAQMNWGQPDMSGAGSGMEDDLSGRSSFDASDYEGGEEPGYVSGPGSGFATGSMNEGYGEMGYSSDFGPRS